MFELTHKLLQRMRHEFEEKMKVRKVLEENFIYSMRQRPRPKRHAQGRREKLVSGGLARIFDDLFLVRRPTSTISRHTVDLLLKNHPNTSAVGPPITLPWAPITRFGGGGFSP
jgi:hypothetical protein